MSSRRVIVTGGSGGIGRVVVKAFAARGDRVVNLDRLPFPDGGPLGVHTVDVDLSSSTSITSAFAEADRHFNSEAPDVLACLAAFSKADAFLEVKPADLEAMLAVNVAGTFLCGQEAGRRMRKAGRGHIIVVTSIAGLQAWSGESVYSATKAAQASIVQSMAIELAPFGILVNAVAPGIIDVRSAGMAGTRDGEVFRHEMERSPLGRFGAPEEIASAILHLSQVSWMTGQTMIVDGGYMAAGLAIFGERKERAVRQ